MALPAAFHLLSGKSDEDSYWLHRQGIEWYQQELLPNLDYLDKAKDIDSELKSEIWYLIAAMHELNFAPLQAIAAYQKVLQYDPDFFDASFSLVELLEDVGQYKKAFDTINKILDQWPEEEELHQARQRLQDALNYNETPKLTNQNFLWQCCEKLASGQFQAVVDAIPPGTTDVELLKCLACAYSGLADIAPYQSVWQKVVAIDPDEAFDFLDWYYFPISLLNDKQFWDTFKRQAPIVKPDYLI